MTRFYLVRHGQIEHGGDVADPPLSSQGRAETHAVAATLAPLKITHVYASPLHRAQESAAPLATVLGLPVVVELRLRERINFGDLPGQRFADFVALWEQCNRERDFVPSIGDSSRAAGERVEAFLAAVHAASPGSQVAAFAHGGVIADFLLNVSTPSELAQLCPPFAAQPYSGEVMRNGAITVVEIAGTKCSAEKVVVEAIAMTGHLAAI